MTPTPGTSQPLLVFGDDGSEPSDLAWQFLLAHAWPGWAIDVMTADEADIKWGEPSDPEAWTPEWDRTQSLTGSPKVRFLNVAADPRAMLAERGDADVLVVGIRSHSYLEAMVTGSTTEWLLHHPPAPLLVVGSGDTVNEVVVCADGSPHSAAAVHTFTSLPLAAATRVTVVSVNDGRTDAQTAAASAVQALEGKVAALETVTTHGPATAAILDHIDEAQPNLVVLGTSGLTGWKRLTLGSTAAAVVRAVPCSSLVACVND